MGHTGLVLTGRCRAAYQVGALSALAEILGPGPMPFDIIAGISAGAINSFVAATGAEVSRARRSGSATGSRSPGPRVPDGHAPPRVDRGPLGPRPLRGRPHREVGHQLPARSGAAPPLAGKRGADRSHAAPSPLGRLRAVGVSATNYHTGAGITFYEGASEIQPWLRSTRLGVRTRITLDHVMASAAIPLFFPPIRIDRTFYGDGCVRMNHPMSPAIHLGADRILAVSVRYLRPPAETLRREAKEKDDNLPLSEIAGVLLNAVFLDSLDSDLERLDRINRTLAFVPRTS